MTADQYAIHLVDGGFDVHALELDHRGRPAQDGETVHTRTLRAARRIVPAGFKRATSMIGDPPTLFEWWVR